ncbi:PAS domain S-box protein [Myxococcota bacterium]|nr:PAS domain S-box protein [Myxococcota bacterium]
MSNCFTHIAIYRYPYMISRSEPKILTGIGSALQNSKQFIESLLNLTPAILYIYDIAEKKNVYSNDGIMNVLGYSAQEIKDFGDELIVSLMHPDDFTNYVATILPRYNEVADREIIKHQYRMKHRDGNWKYLESSELIYGRDTEGKPTQIFGLITDVTDMVSVEMQRSRTEEALRESEERYRSLFNGMTEGFALHQMIYDDDGNPVDYRFLEINPAFEKLTGLRRDVVSGRCLSEVIPGEDPKWVKMYGRVAMRGEPCHFENYSQVLNKHFEVFAYRPAPDQFAVLFVDITERKNHEQELKESEERFKTLHNASFGGITIHEKGRIIECNNGLAEITGYSYDELIGMDGLLLISEDTRETVIKNITSGYEKPYEAIGVRKNGERYPIRLEARNIPYKGRNVRVTEFRDITDFKNAEKEMRELENKLLQAQKMESIGRLAGGVAHDFNNMLGVIIGHSELALDKSEPHQPVLEDLIEIKKAAERSANLTRQLLAFARKQTIAPKVVDINQTVEGMLLMLRRMIGEDIDMHWKPFSGQLLVLVDPAQIDQILANLCVNARDAIKGVGQVIIETESVVFDEHYCSIHAGVIPGKYTMIAVTDNGTGMDSETLNHLFEPFYTTKEAGHGTGLGLATVYGAVKQNNGFINVYSEEGHGTTFKIYLPEYKLEVPHSQVKASDEVRGSGTETILVVEDEPSILRMATVMLTKFGYRVIGARSPLEAISIVENNPGTIDLLITDVIMPGMNGREMAEKLLSKYPSMKRIFMSGYTAEVIATRGVLEEGVEFIQKPFSSKELGTKIRQVLDQ